MKTKKILFSLIALTTLASCGTTSDPTSAQPQESVNNVSGTIAFTQDSYQVERGSTLTVRVKIDLQNTTELSASIEIGDETIVELSKDTGVSFTLTGKKIGTTTITVRCVANNEIYAQTTVEVIPVIQSLRRVWTNLMKKTNYTLSTYNPDSTSDDPVSVLRVTDAGLTVTDNDGKAVVNESYSGEDDDGNTINYSYDLYGLALDKNNHVVYMMKDALKDEWITPTSALVTTSGTVLNNTNFYGLGSESSGWSDNNYYFFGLQGINPNWLTNTKEDGNEYTITGTSSDIDSIYAEINLWELVDPKGRADYLNENSTATLLDVANEITTVINVLDNSDVKITITDSSGSERYAVLSDVGTTTLDTTLAAQATSLAAQEIALPALASSIQLAIEGIKKDDFSYESSLQFEDNGPEYSYSFYANSQYVFYYYPLDTIAAYKAKYSKDILSDGYVLIDGAIYSFSLTETKADDGTLSATISNVTLAADASKNYTMKNCTYFLSDSNLFDEANSGLFYTFVDGSNYTTNNGSSLKGSYLSENEEVGDYLSNFIFESLYNESTTASALAANKYTSYNVQSMITPTIDTDSEGNSYCKSLYIMSGAFNSDSSSSTYGYGYGAELTLDFQGIAKTNTYHSLITAITAPATSA